METKMQCTTTVTASLDMFRTMADVVETCAGHADRGQCAYAVLTLAGETTDDGGEWYTLTAYATDRYRLARVSFPYNPYDGDVTPGTFAVEARGFAKAIAAITKAAGGKKKCGGALVTVTADDSGTVTVAGAGVTVALAVPAGGIDAEHCHRIYAGMFADADARPAADTPAAFAPDTFGVLAACGAAAGASYWRVIGWGKGGDPLRVPVLYRAGRDGGAGPIALDILAMPVVVKK
jgi:hypothetical protein